MGHCLRRFRMMDSIKNDGDRLTLTAGGRSHDQPDSLPGGDFRTLGFLRRNADLTPIVAALETVLGASWVKTCFRSTSGDHDRFSEFDVDYPSGVTARLPLIIRAVGSRRPGSAA